MKNPGSLLLAAAVGFALVAAGCGRDDTPPAGPVRIFSSSAGATHILLQLGAGPALAAIDEYGGIVPGSEAIPTVGRGEAVSLERLAELGVNTAVVWNYQSRLADGLRQAGIRVVELAPFRLADYPDAVRQLAALAGREAAADALIADLADRLPAAAAPPAGRSVYFELYSSYRAVGPASYAGDLLRLAGGRNIVAESSPTGLFSREQLLQAAPEVIFFVDGFTAAAEIAGRPGFQALPAVRAGRIYGVDRRLLTEGIDPAGAVAFLAAKLKE